MPKEFGVFNDASLNPSIANSSNKNCQNIGIWYGSVGSKNLWYSGKVSGYSVINKYIGVINKVISKIAFLRNLK